MSEMVDRMCRAAVTAGSGNPRHWDEYSEIMKESWRLNMRAAIAVLREPTEAMVDTGAAELSLAYSSEPGEGLDYPPVPEIWRAMIDAVLKD